MAITVTDKLMVTRKRRKITFGLSVITGLTIAALVHISNRYLAVDNSRYICKVRGNNLLCAHTAFVPRNPQIQFALTPYGPILINIGE